MKLDRKTIVYGSIMCFLQLLDMVCTLIGVHSGGVEFNPVARFVLEKGDAWFVAAKLMCAFPIAFWLARDVGMSKTKKFVIIALIALYVIVSVWNILQLIILWTL